MDKNEILVPILNAINGLGEEIRENRRLLINNMKRIKKEQKN